MPKYFCCLKAHTLISYSIFDFEVFRVWPLPLTSEDHLGSKKLYHTKAHIWISIWLLLTTSLYLVLFSRKLRKFRVCFWPLTPKDHLGLTNLTPFESQYMASYLTSMDTISQSRTVFEIFDFKVFKVWLWPLNPKGHLGLTKFYTIRKPIYDFLFDFYGHHFSISYRFRDIRFQSF